jgi:hypothetical protein
MSVFTAAEQTTVPPEVDTMREEICPVCGSDDSYVGDKCSVCGFEKPPSIFMDPDTSLAQNVNLRQDDQEDAADDGAGELQCPNCGETFPSAEALNAAGDPHLAPAAQTIPAEEDLEVPQGAEEEPEPTEGPEDNQMAPPPPAGQEGPPEPPEDEEEEVPPGQEQDEEEQPEGPLGQPDEEEPEPPEQPGGAPEEEPPEQGQVEQVDPEAMAEQQYAADQEGMQQTGYEEGDICPNCGQGLLQPIGISEAVPEPGQPPQVEESDEMPQGGPRPFPPGSEGDDEPEPEEEEEAPGLPPAAEEEQDDQGGQEDGDEDGGDEEEEGEDGDDGQPPWLKKKKAVHMNYRSSEGAHSTMPTRPRRATPRQATTEAAQAQTPRSSVRTALHASLNTQAGVLRRMTAACQQERLLRLAAEARISTLERQMFRFATLAGADADPELRGINEEGYRIHANLMAKAASLHTADARDPAQPVPEGAPEAPIVTEQQAAEPAARTDVTQLGATPVTDVSADATIAVDQPYGTEAFEPMNLNEVDVTAPVQNTQGHLPPEQTIIPVEVRVGDPDDPQPSYGWTLDGGNPSGQTGGSVGSGQPTQGAPGSPPGVMPGTRASRNDGQVSLGALRLARLRMQAGIAPPNQDDLSIAASIQDNPAMTTEAVNTEIKTLTQVLSVQVPNGRVATANRRLVPRSAQGPSEAPSLAPTSEGPIRAHASTGAVSDDEILFE